MPKTVRRTAGTLLAAALLALAGQAATVAATVADTPAGTAAHGGWQAVSQGQIPATPCASCGG
jgi:hypothetical protein